MERRKFIRGTIGLGLFTLPGTDNFSRRWDTKTAIEKTVSRGDILRKGYPVGGSSWIALYQGNGRFGSCVGPWGLHTAPEKNPAFTIHGATQFTHMKHCIRGRFNADYLISPGRIYWENEPQQVSEYEQYQSFYDGTITTRFATADYKVAITSWIDTVQKDVAGFMVDATGNCPAIIVDTPRKLAAMYEQQLDIAVDDKLDNNSWTADIKCLNAHTTLRLKSNARMERVNQGVKLHLQPGRNIFLVAVNSEVTFSGGESLKNTKAAWHTTWENTGWMDLPDEAAQKIWVRSVAYTLYSHNDDGFGCSPPTGLSGNGWPFPFPFDSGCRHLLLLMTGQTETARKWIEYWYSRFDGLKEYTRRFYKSDGIFLPHVFPYGRANDYHSPGVPNKYYHPIYNSALMIRLADQTAVMLNDPAWTKKYSEPLIKEAAKFYFNHLKKGDDGFWHMHVIPSISLDESGETDKRDYVSGLISAQYALQKAIEYGLDDNGMMQTILSDGLAYKTLLAENGMYFNHAGLTLTAFSKQKHPDQLFPLIHTPLGGTLDVPHKRAHELRYDITFEAKKPRFLGHTLGEFILASARMHNREAWAKDWSMILPAKYCDPDLIQFYESTGNTLAFYVTTHGLFAQAILETTVSTWWNRLDLGTCIPWKGTVRFGNIRTLAGVTVTGEIINGTGHATLQAWKDVSLNYKGQTIVLKKGQKKTVPVNKN